MEYPDPFSPGSPWDEDQEKTAPKTEAPKSPDTAPAPRDPVRVGFTLKAGPGFEAPWLTGSATGATAAEAAHRGAELLGALRAEGLITTTPKAAQMLHEQYGAPKAVAGARTPPRPPQGATAPPLADDNCPHGRKLVEKPTWAALFCQAPDKAAQCDPLWRQKDGSYKAK